MSAAEALQRGDLGQALLELKAEIRAEPQNASLRIFLFQLLAVNGEWQKAMTQLQLCGQLDPAAELMVTAYTAAIQCERLREEIFAGKRTPLVLGEPEPWVAWMIQAQSMQSQGQSDVAEELRAKAFDAAPTTSGRLEFRASGKGSEEQRESAEFAWLADADLSLGPILECMLDGRYYWVPINHMESMRIEPPTDLRDMVWLPTQFTWVGGGQQLGFIPTRYQGSEASDDDAIRLARRTEWVSDKNGFESGRGQRLLTTDQSEFGLLDLREIVFAVDDTQPASSGVDGDG